jgi:hypothetical protein
MSHVVWFKHVLQKTSPTKSSDLFDALASDDGFDPRGPETSVTSEFGEFYSATSQLADTVANSDSHDDFADFHSAFSDTSPAAATTPIQPPPSVAAPQVAQNTGNYLQLCQ